MFISQILLKKRYQREQHCWNFYFTHYWNFSYKTMTFHKQASTMSMVHLKFPQAVSQINHHGIKKNYRFYLRFLPLLLLYSNLGQINDLNTQSEANFIPFFHHCCLQHKNYSHYLSKGLRVFQQLNEGHKTHFFGKLEVSSVLCISSRQKMVLCYLCKVFITFRIYH